MIANWRRLLLALLLFFGLAAPAAARVDWRIEKTLPLSGSPSDVAVSADGKKVFVLMENGEVRIYSPDGSLQENLGIVGRADRIAVSPEGDRLYLSSGKEGRLGIASIDYIQTFDLTGSPFRGPADAPVEIVAFSDFQ